MTAQDIHGWFVTLLAIIVLALAVAMPIVVLVERRSNRRDRIDPSTSMPDHLTLQGLATDVESNVSGIGGSQAEV